jgi:hypothetical protein
MHRCCQWCQLNLRVDTKKRAKKQLVPRALQQPMIVRGHSWLGSALWMSRYFTTHHVFLHRASGHRPSIDMQSMMLRKYSCSVLRRIHPTKYSLRQPMTSAFEVQSYVTTLHTMSCGDGFQRGTSSISLGGTGGSGECRSARSKRKPLYVARRRIAIRMSTSR